MWWIQQKLREWFPWLNTEPAPAACAPSSPPVVFCPDPEPIPPVPSRPNSPRMHLRLIMAYLRSCRRGGATTWEIASRTGLDPAQVYRRMAEAERAGLVERTNRTRPTPFGRRSTVWRVA